MEKGNRQLIEMMSLSEEINNINTKVNQLVQDLHGTQHVLVNLKELTDKLTDKVGIFTTAVHDYKPTKIDDVPGKQKASWEEEGIEPTRIVVTPENQHEYIMEQPNVPKPRAEVIDELTSDDFGTEVVEEDPVPVKKKVVKKKAKTTKKKKPIKGHKPKKKFGVFGSLGKSKRK